MYINPQQIRFMHKKLTSADRTKGGYSLQYWGEELTTLDIQGTTGSSGIEGINVLQEIYRAEQYAFDGFALSLAANNAAASSGAASITDSLGRSLGKLIGGATGSSIASGAGLLGTVLGTNNPNSNLAAQNIPSLAQLAFTVEMFYNGIVYRGFFTNMDVTESADNFCFQYSMGFTVTQTRGYRRNYFPFHKNPAQGASDYGTPNSFSGNTK